MVDEFCRAAEFVPTPGGTPLHLVATFQRGVREYDFVHPMVDEFCRAAEFVPTPRGTPLHLVATFQRTVIFWSSNFINDIIVSEEDVGIS